MATIEGLLARVRSTRRALRSEVRRRRWEARVRIRSALGLPPPEPVARGMYEYARVAPDALVVQIGAHDSSQLDPIRRYILRRGWRGILVEPVPEIFERLKRNYEGIDGLAFENVAIGPEAGVLRLYTVLGGRGDGHLPPWYDALASFSREVLIGHRELIPDIEERIDEIEVPCITFDELCERHDVEHVDVVQIDTEGYDLEILRTIDLDRYRPAAVQFEVLHMDRAMRDEALRVLSQHGFEAIANGMDCLCLDPERAGGDDVRFRSVWRRLRSQCGVDPA